MYVCVCIYIYIYVCNDSYHYYSFRSDVLDRLRASRPARSGASRRGSIIITRVVAMIRNNSNDSGRNNGSNNGNNKRNNTNH